MWPREHGAWSMLAQPFLCALILSREFHWSVIVAAIAVVAAFLMREPLVVLARQRFVWRERKPETAVAKRWLVWEALLLAVATAALLFRWPWSFLLAFGAGTVLLTAVAVWMTVKNLQRSTWLHLVSAAALSATGLAACLSATGELRSWAWPLWAMTAAHAAAGILVVHARLEARIAARSHKTLASRFRLPAQALQVILLAGALLCVVAGRALLAGALLLSAAVHLWDLYHLTSPRSLATPLTTVGLRAMSLSIAFSALVVYGLW